MSISFIKLINIFKQIGYKTIDIENYNYKIEKVVTNKTEFVAVVSDNKIKEISEYELSLENKISSINNKVLINGYCDICNKKTRFNYSYSVDSREDGRMNWREGMVCCNCGFSNRTRLLLRVIRETVNKNQDIYITEQKTLTYKYLKQRYPSIIGSEYLSPEYESGKTYDGIRHEDMMNLSFRDCSLDCLISADVLEHVSDIYKAVDEAYRVLRNEGYFIFSVPFLYNDDLSEIRSIIQNGQLVKLMSPEIHGNPISKEGSLVFTIPGWDFVIYCEEKFTIVEILVCFLILS